MAIGEGGEEWLGMDRPGWDFASQESLAAVEDARGNIERVRKRDVELRVVDRRGEPLARLPVEIAAAGLPIHVTEFWAHTDRLAAG